MNALKFYIGGEWVDPSHAETIEVINPATEEVIETISAGSAEDVDRAVSAARTAFHDFSRTSRGNALNSSRRFAKPTRSGSKI